MMTSILQILALVNVLKVVNGWLLHNMHNYTYLDKVNVLTMDVQEVE